MTGRQSGPDGGCDESRSAGDDWTVTDWVRRRAERSPDRTAVVDAADGASLTYAALDTAVDRLAGRLAALGVSASDHLGALVGTRVDAVTLVHAAARLGATLVPVDPRGEAEDVRDRLDRADATAVVCERPTETVAVAATAASGDVSLPVASLDATETERVTQLDDVEPVPVTPTRWGLDDRLLVLYTSGTTGDPKPVSLSAGNVLASAMGSALRLGVRPGDRWCCELPAYHMGGIAPFYRCALYGTTAVVVERTPTPEEASGRGGFDAARTLAALHDHAATGVSLVPTQLRRLFETADARDGPGALPASLRFVLLGGGPASDELIAESDRRGVPVCPTYGTTETASQVTTARPGEATANVGTVGRPLAFTDVVVARPVEDDGTDATTARERGDSAPDGFRECDPGERGAVLVRGPTVTPGYYGAPEETAAAFAGGWFRTGDSGHLAEGRLYVHGRRSDRIVTGGENVAPETVADVVRSVPGVRSAAVVGVPDSEWGERVAALVVREERTTPSAEGTDREAPTRETVLTACREALPGHAVPQTVRFVAELPRTASGTVDREAARAIAAGGDGSEGRRESGE